MDWDGAKKDWRIWLLIISLIVSVLLIVDVTDPYVKEDGEYSLNTNLQQGLELQGGARVLIRPQPEDGEVTGDLVAQTIDTLRTRVNAFGLADMTIRPVDIAGETHIQIELAGEKTADLEELLNRTGRFEARIPFTVQDGKEFSLGSETYTPSVAEETLSVGGSQVALGEDFNLSSGGQTVAFTYINRTQQGAVVSPLAFSGQDVLGVDINPQRSGVTRRGGSWEFRFQVSISDEAAQRVTDVAQAFNAGGTHLTDPVTSRNAQLTLILDDDTISELSIASTFQQNPVRQPLITGGEDSREAAVTEMNQLISVLESGALPAPIAIVQSTEVSPTLGQQFLRTAVLAIILAILAVSIVVFARYRDVKIAAPLTLTAFSELVILLGFAAAVNWTIDLPSIAGIIAAIGTGVDDQIIIADERGRKKVMSLKKRFKRAFFIIFTAAASTIGAMLPLTQIGAGTITGFALTTIAGVIIGVFITRPAYARVLQYLDQ